MQLSSNVPSYSPKCLVKTNNYTRYGHVTQRAELDRVLKKRAFQNQYILEFSKNSSLTN